MTLIIRRILSTKTPRPIGFVLILRDGEQDKILTPRPIRCRVSAMKRADAESTRHTPPLEIKVE